MHKFQKEYHDERYQHKFQIKTLRHVVAHIQYGISIINTPIQFYVNNVENLQCKKTHANY